MNGRFNRLGLTWALLAAASGLGGCASAPDPFAYPNVRQPDSAIVKGSTRFLAGVTNGPASVHIRRVGDLDWSDWFDPNSPVYLSPGGHKLDLQVDDSIVFVVFTTRLESTFSVEVVLAAGHSYWITSQRQGTPPNLTLNTVLWDETDAAKPVKAAGWVTPATEVEEYSNEDFAVCEDIDFEGVAHYEPPLYYQGEYGPGIRGPGGGEKGGSHGGPDRGRPGGYPSHPPSIPHQPRPGGGGGSGGFHGGGGGGGHSGGGGGGGGGGHSGGGGGDHRH